MEWYEGLGIVAVGLAAGFINTVAAGGSLLTLPILMMIGLPPTVANATNRIAILFQNIFCRSRLQKARRFSLSLQLVARHFCALWSRDWYCSSFDY